jgi:alkaline phosphatase
MRFRWMVACVALVAAGCQPASSSASKPYSAVLLIGDGMGPAYVAAARHSRAGGVELALDRMPHTAMVQTHSASHLVTDSAAAATAMACGELTTNSALGQDATARPDKPGKRIENLAEWAADRGVLVGVVTNTTVTDATPAAWYAHTHHWHDERANAQQSRKSRLSFLLGGGAKYMPAGEDWSPWQVVRDPSRLPSGPATPEMRVLGLFAHEHLPYENPRAQLQVRLRALAEWGLRAMMSSERPFLLIIEGGLIDHAGHENLGRTAINETLAFDSVVGYVTRTVDPSTTLVLATSPNECGGLAFNGYPERGDTSLDRRTAAPILTFSSGLGLETSTIHSPFTDDPRPATIEMESALHTGTDVTLFADGLGAEAVHGTMDLTGIHRLLREHLRRNPSAE